MVKKKKMRSSQDSNLGPLHVVYSLLEATSDCACLHAAIYSLLETVDCTQNESFPLICNNRRHTKMM